jgi:hypothetical protein
MKANKIPAPQDELNHKDINVRLNRDTYFLLKDIKHANGLKSIDATVRELVRYVALLTASK